MNWYKKAISFIKNIYSNNSVNVGEYWIDDNGSVMAADGDIGEYNHESYVIETVLAKYDLDYLEYEEMIDSQDGLNKIRQIVTDPEELQMLTSRNYDPRLFAIKEWGWKRVQNNNIDTYYLTKNDIKIILDGIYEIFFDESEMNRTLFNIYVYSNKSYYSNIPFSVLESENPLALREFKSY